MKKVFILIGLLLAGCSRSTVKTALSSEQHSDSVVSTAQSVSDNTVILSSDDLAIDIAEPLILVEFRDSAGRYRRTVVRARHATVASKSVIAAKRDSTSTALSTASVSSSERIDSRSVSKPSRHFSAWWFLLLIPLIGAIILTRIKKRAAA